MKLISMAKLEFFKNKHGLSMAKLDLRKNKHGKARFFEKISMTSIRFFLKISIMYLKMLKKTSQKCVLSY